jgi:hypothetical protein
MPNLKKKSVTVTTKEGNSDILCFDLYNDIFIVLNNKRDLSLTDDQGSKGHLSSSTPLLLSKAKNNQSLEHTGSHPTRHKRFARKLYSS